MDLPTDLVDYILAMLPLPSLLRCQTLSKRCYQLLRQPHFLQLRRALSPPFHCFSFWNWFHEGKSIKLVHLSLHGDFDLLSSAPLRTFPLSEDYLASSRGLLCCKDLQHPLLLIHNPVTDRSRLLPLAPEPYSVHDSRNFVGLFVNPTTGDFMVILVGNRDGALGRTQVFDSSRDSWTVTEQIEEDDFMPVTKPISLNSQVYWMARGSDLQIYLLAYDVKERYWRIMESQWGVDTLPITLMERRGSLHAVVYAYGSIFVWRVPMDMLEWRLVGSLPQDLWDDLTGRLEDMLLKQWKPFMPCDRLFEWFGVSIAGHEEFLFLVAWMTRRTLIYNFCTNERKQTPEIHRSVWEACKLFVFEPGLDNL